MLAAEVRIFDIQLKALLNRIHRLLGGDVHDSKVRLEPDAWLLGIPVLTVQLLRCLQIEWTLWAEETTN